MRHALYKLTFDKHQIYDSLEIGITIGAILRHGADEVFCEAKVDTGASVEGLNEEEAELTAYEQVDDLMILLKARARLKSLEFRL